MKKVEYICDQCKRKSETSAGWLEITSNKEFGLNISIPFNGTSYSNYDDFHLCSEICTRLFFTGT